MRNTWDRLSIHELTSRQINDAISALDTDSSETQTIFIEEGTYDEQVYIPKLSGALIIYGQTEECVLQTWPSLSL